MDVKENVKWALRFAELDLEKLRPGDRLNLLFELHEFFVLPDALRLGVTPYSLPLPESVTPEHWGEIRQLQEKVRGLFGGLVQTKQQWGVSLPEIPLREMKVGSYLHPPLANPDPAVEHGKAQLSFSAPWQDAFLLLLTFCVWQANLDNLVTCPECETLFLRNRRQRYCSRTCTNRATLRAWRKEPEHRAQEKKQTVDRLNRLNRKARSGKKGRIRQ